MVYSVIIVTYNGGRWIEKCLNHLFDQNVRLSVVVVDNCSTDLTLDIIKSCRKEVHLIELNENVGFGKANNIGLKYIGKSEYDFVLLLNQDVYLQKGCLDILGQCAKSNPSYGVLSPIHIYAKVNEGLPAVLDYNFKEYLFKETSSNLIDELILTQKLNNEVYPISFVNAAIWLLSSKCVKMIGGFDPIYEHYGEDRNYANRVLSAGLKIGICKSAQGLHDRIQEDSEYKKLNKSKFLFLSAVTNPLKKVSISDSLISIIAINWLTFRNNKGIFPILIKSIKDMFWALRKIRACRKNLKKYNQSSWLFIEPEV